jgi:predicted RNA-binding protein with PIN domain
MATTPLTTVLLVDGYNIIGASIPLQQVQDRQGLEAARSQLTSMLANYSAFQGYQTRLIFDAHYRQTQANQERITDLLHVHFTQFGETADTHIEKFCAQARHRGLPSSDRIIVATSDHAQKLTVMGFGADWMSAQRLLQDIHSVTGHIQSRQHSHKPAVGRLLAHGLDPEAKWRLEQLRMGKQSF